MDVRNLKKLGTAAMGLALTIAAVPHAASAQDRPTYATHDEDTIKGRVVSVTGQYDVSVRDDRGYVDHVRMHQGTIINPTGLSLSPGMTVTVLGVNEGSILAANEIDTPYTYEPSQAPIAYGGPYAPAYYGGYGYGYPGYFGYGYGYPAIAIGFGFGGYGGYRGGYYGGYYGGYGRGYHGGYGGGYHGGGVYHGGYNGGARGGYSGSHGSLGGGSRGSAGVGGGGHAGGGHR